MIIPEPDPDPRKTIRIRNPGLNPYYKGLSALFVVDTAII